MHGLFLLGSRDSRNDPIKLADPRPLEVYRDDLETGNAGRDGFTILSKASPTMQGEPPSVPGAIGRAYRGPSQDFEQ